MKVMIFRHSELIRTKLSTSYLRTRRGRASGISRSRGMICGHRAGFDVRSAVAKAKWSRDDGERFWVPRGVRYVGRLTEGWSGRCRVCQRRVVPIYDFEIGQASSWSGVTHFEPR